MKRVYDGMYSSPDDTRAYVVQDGVLYENFMSTRWLIKTTCVEEGLPDDATVDQVLSAYKERKRAEEEWFRSHDNFYDRCHGVLNNPM